jgi:capsule polysaccharide export protein KpsE/RkpR
MNNKLSDTIKSEIMLQTQLEIAQQLVAQLQKENTELQQQLEKINKKKKPEVNTSEF